MGSRTRALIIGGVAGAALGLAAAWLFVRSVEEEETLTIEVEGEEAVAQRSLDASKVMRLGVSILGVLRQIVDLGRGA